VPRRDAGWAGVDGNIDSDPAFVDAAGGDYRLAAGSPAIDAGTTTGAPTYAIDGARRDSQPDIGAFEYGAAARPRLTVTLERLGGAGAVTSGPAGIKCGTVCHARFDLGTTVVLAAKASRGSRFLGWRGGCTGKGRCKITVGHNKAVIARFGP
jgi:hypothetical protein